MYALLEYKHLQNWIDAYKQKYPNVTENMTRQSLTYFNDIDLKALGNDLTLKILIGKSYSKNEAGGERTKENIFSIFLKKIKVVSGAYAEKRKATID
jgi:hypothetical protein